MTLSDKKAQKALMDRAEREGWEEKFDKKFVDYEIVENKQSLFTPKSDNSPIDYGKIFKRKNTMVSVKKIKSFIRSLLHQSYEQWKREVLKEAIAFFDKHKDEPMTGNVVNLELKVMLDALNEGKKDAKV